MKTIKTTVFLFFVLGDSLALVQGSAAKANEATSNATTSLRRRKALLSHKTKAAFPPSVKHSQEKQIVKDFEFNDMDHGGDEVPNAPPSLTLNKAIYAEDEPITVSYTVGSPKDPYYSLLPATSLKLDFEYPKWSIGLFMRDADPQGGSLQPLVSINLCRAMGCDPNDLSYMSYSSIVTFGDEYCHAMQGQWPLLVSEYGTGYDAYVLDGKGAAASGPLEFNISDEGIKQESRPTEYIPSQVTESSFVNEDVVRKQDESKKNGLLTYNHAFTKKVSSTHSVASANNKVSSANCLIGGTKSSAIS